MIKILLSTSVQNNGITTVKIKEIKIEPGKTSKNNLLKRYGPPVFESVFNKNTIYYVSHVSTYKNLSDRKTTDLIVLEILLDQNNVVETVNKFDKNDVSNINISNKKTLDNNDKSIMFFKEIINNLRRRNVEN